MCKSQKSIKETKSKLITKNRENTWTMGGKQRYNGHTELQKTVGNIEMDYLCIYIVS